MCSRIGSPPSNSISIEFVDHGASMSNHYYYSALITLDPLDHASTQGAFGGAWHIIFWLWDATLDSFHTTYSNDDLIDLSFPLLAQTTLSHDLF